MIKKEIASNVKCDTIIRYEIFTIDTKDLIFEMFLQTSRVEFHFERTLFETCQLHTYVYSSHDRVQ